MILLRQITDRLVLQPTRYPVYSFGKSPRQLPFRKGALEIWTRRWGCETSDEAAVFVLKFTGTGGRAERATIAPLDYWDDVRAEFWAVNPPGYGGSSGRASLKYLAEAGAAAYDELRRIAGDRPIIVSGNSLGTVTALHLAATRDVAGLILRNPPPLRQMILGRHGWWNLWLGAALIAAHVPDSLCSVRNAGRCTAPAIFVTSARDRVVPPFYQLRILRAYAGKKRVLVLDDADHDTRLTPVEQQRFEQLVGWLRARTGLSVPAVRELCV